jgi:gamma-glutamylcyclotransferase (GGCT)/AIG2-like uncharacterized protein YtfP
VDQPDVLVVYGTLRSGTGWRERLGVAHRVESLGPCTLSGSLHDLGWYPGFVPDGDEPVRAEALRLLDDEALAAFDRFEGVIPERVDAGEYRRVVIEVTIDGEDRRRSAWLYVLNRPAPPGSRVEGGDWLAHLADRDGDRSVDADRAPRS